MNPRRLWIVLVLPAALLSGFRVEAPPAPVVPEVATAAGEPSKDAGVPPTDPQGPTDPAELEAFLDELMAKDMEERHIPGAAVSVVKDGKLFFAKGYGFADLENKIPVDAELTAFATGSMPHRPGSRATGASPSASITHW